MNKVLLSLCGGAAFAAAAMLGAPGLTGEAKALDYLCPAGPQEGQIQTAVIPGGQGIAEMSLCMDDPDYYDQADSQQQKAPPFRHPADDLVDVANGFNILTAKLLEIMSDPEIMAFESGGLWKYSGDPKACKAAFLNKNGILAVFAPTPTFNGIVTMYQSEAVPASKEPKQVTVELQEVDINTDKVVMRMTTPAIHDESSIIVIYDGKDYPMFLNTMKDRARYKVILDQKPVVDVTMRDGFLARDQLQKCKRA